LLIDPGLLHGVQAAVGCQSFESGDFTLHRGDGRDAGRNRRAVDYYFARTALSESAPKPWAMQVQVIAEDIKQRRGGFNIHRVGTAVHVQFDLAHNAFLPVSLAMISIATILSGNPPLGGSHNRSRLAL
jgi:hypothetical protein